MPPQQGVHLDWVFNSLPLPYSFQDLESRSYEFSECFFPGEQAEQVAKELCESFGKHFRFSEEELRMLRADPFELTDEMLENAIRQADDGGIEAILAYILNYVDSESEPEPAITESRALRVGRLLELFIPVFSGEIAAALELSQNPPANLRATAQTTELFNHTAEIIHMCLTADNLEGTNLNDISTVLDLFVLTSKLIIAFSGIMPLATAKTPQSYLLSNARCFAGMRALCVNRECVLRLLGRSEDFRRTNELKMARISPVNSIMPPLPPPRFMGQVNGLCPEIKQLEQLAEETDSDISSVSLPFKPNISMESEISDKMEADLQLFLDQLTERRRIFPGQQEYDELSGQETNEIETLLNKLPQSRLRGSLEGVENIHGAIMAIKMAADCRSSCEAEMESPAFSAGSIVYNCGQAKTAEPNEATQFLKNRLASSYTRPFGYCGKPCVDGIVKPHLLRAAEINFEGFERSNIDFTRVKHNMQGALPLNLFSSIVREPRYKPVCGGTSEQNIGFLIQAINFPLFLRALARFGLCGTPGNAETILMQHLMPEVSVQPTNNSLACVKHVREVVLKEVSHILFLIIYKAALVSPAMRFYVARLYSKIPELEEYLICVMSQPLGIYTTTADQRLKEYGLCLFRDVEETQYPSDEFAVVTDLLHGHPSEFRNGQFSLYSCTRRLLIVNCVLRIVYGMVAHSRHREIEFSELYNRVSANYVSAMLQSAQSEMVEDAEASGPNGSSSEAGRRTANVVGGLGSLGINTKQLSQELDPLNINSFYDFIVGENASNNPTKQNMACTISCTFPCFQALRVDNISVLVAFLKLAVHLLPAQSSGESADLGSIFEVPGLSDARNQITKLVYLTAVSAKKVDTFRFNREIVCAGEEERDWQEARELLKAFSGKLNVEWLDSDIKNGLKQFGDSMIDAELGYCGKFESM